MYPNPFSFVDLMFLLMGAFFVGPTIIISLYPKRSKFLYTIMNAIGITAIMIMCSLLMFTHYLDWLL